MKNFYKVFLSVIFALLMINQGFSADKRGWREVAGLPPSTPSTANTGADIQLKGNGQVYKYVPSDTKHDRGIAQNCDKNGNLIQVKNFGHCSTFHSKSTKTTWIIRNTHAVGITELFEVINGSPILFASWSPNDFSETYASLKAKKYARIKGDNTDLAKKPDEEDHKTAEVTPKDILNKGAGALTDGLRDVKIPFPKF